jgi:hypothetical protein
MNIISISDMFMQSEVDYAIMLKRRIMLFIITRSQKVYIEVSMHERLFANRPNILHLYVAYSFTIMKVLLDFTGHA